MPPFKARAVRDRKQGVCRECAGYAVSMTDSQTSETKQARRPRRAEPPSRPGPLRQDDGEGQRSGGHDDDASASEANDKHASESGGHTIPIEDEQSRPAAGLGGG